MTSQSPRSSRPPKKTLQPFTARLTPDAKRKLQALAQIRGQPAYEVLEEAFWRLWEALPPAQREAAERLLRLLDQSRGELSS